MKYMSYQKGEMYLDNRNCPDLILPGIPGLGGPRIIKGGTILEIAIATCSHCHFEIVLNPNRVRPRGYCAKCHHYICDKPGCSVECIPMDKILDDIMEDSARNLNIGEI